MNKFIDKGTKTYILYHNMSVVAHASNNNIKKTNKTMIINNIILYVYSYTVYTIAKCF